MRGGEGGPAPDPVHDPWFKSLLSAAAVARISMAAKPGQVDNHAGLG